MAYTQREVVNCPHCGMENATAQTACQSCSHSLTIYIGPTRTLPRSFGLGSLMILVATIAFGLGIFREVPGLGVLVLVVITPAMIRTIGVGAQRREDKRVMTLEDGLYVLVGSIGLMLATLIASFLVFLAACLPVSPIMVTGGDYGFDIAMIVASLVGLSVGFFMLRRFWPYRG